MTKKTTYYMTAKRGMLKALNLALPTSHKTLYFEITDLEREREMYFQVKHQHMEIQIYQFLMQELMVTI